MVVVQKTSRPLLLAVCVAIALLAAACDWIEVSDAQTISPPDAGASDFASAFSMDEGRIVARAVVEGSPVVYVFDRAGAGWTRTATLTPGPEATSYWGSSVAVSGDTIAITDPAVVTYNENYGAVEIHDFTAGVWTVTETVRSDIDWTRFARDVWLTDDGLLVEEGRVCDSYCGLGRAALYQRSGGSFELATTTPRFGAGMSAGVDQDRIAFGAPGGFEYETDAWDNELRVWDTSVAPPGLLASQTTPYGDPWAEPPEPLHEGYYRNVDLSGDLLAYENCCSTESQLHIMRDSGAGYVEEATFPLADESAAISTVPGAVLVADRDFGGWHTYIDGANGWQHSSNLVAPDAVAGQFAQPPVAVGNELAVRGNGVLHVLTVDLQASS